MFNFLFIFNVVIFLQSPAALTMSKRHLPQDQVKQKELLAGHEEESEEEDEDEDVEVSNLS